MAFPTNPTNGQQTTVNGIIYTYNSTLAAWTATTTTGSNISGNNITITNQVSTATLAATGTITATGNITGGNLVTLGTVSTGSITSTANITGGNITTAGTGTIATLSVTGNATSNNKTITTSLAVGATTPSGTAGQIRATNSVTAFYSDGRLKTKVGGIENALDKIDQLTAFLYKHNEVAKKYGYTDDNIYVGLDANKVREVQPEATAIAPFDADSAGNSISGEYYLTVMYDHLVPLIVEAIKELRQEVNKLKGNN